MWRAVAVGVTVAALAASVAIVLHISDQSVASATAVDAHRGDCLTWPPGAAERAVQVDCADAHLFEVADSEAVDISTDPWQSCSRRPVPADLRAGGRALPRPSV
jgi:Septum formation